MGNNTIPQLFRIIIAHEQRHQAQMDRVQATSGFPRVSQEPMNAAQMADLLAAGEIDWKWSEIDLKTCERLKFGEPHGRPQSVQTSVPMDFTDLERSLVHKTETALVDGLALERWTRDPNRKVEFHELSLNRNYDLPNKAYGYFGEVTIGGRQLTALGARQEVEFGKIPGPNPEQRLKDFVFRHFLNTAHWTYADGDPGGFTLKQMLYCTADGKVGRYPDDQLTSVQDWGGSALSIAGPYSRSTCMIS